MELEARLKIFVHDLMSFQSSKEAQERLGFDEVASFYMSRAYFSSEEVRQLLLKCKEQTGKSLSETIEEMLERKRAGGSFLLCTSHHLAPIFQQVFGISKDFQQHPSFKKSLKKYNKTWRLEAQSRQ